MALFDIFCSGAPITLRAAAAARDHPDRQHLQRQRDRRLPVPDAGRAGGGEFVAGNPLISTNDKFVGNSIQAISPDDTGGGLAYQYTQQQGFERNGSPFAGRNLVAAGNSIRSLAVPVAG